MKKVNLLSKAEMRKVMGGVEAVNCELSVCAFKGPGNVLLTGSCGQSINGKQCRCINNDENGVPYQSIEMDGCYA